MTGHHDEFTRYVILLSLVPGKPRSESLIREHVSYLKQLDKKGLLVLCGPFADYSGGMVIIKASSYEHAKQIAEADPFVSSGAETYELRTWQLSCEENNHMGMG